MASMRELSDHTIAVANNNGLEITNLQLQKTMFFALGMHIRRSGGIDELTRDTYDIPFEKWKYGPVVQSEYYRFNNYKENPIEVSGEYNEEYQAWDDFIKTLLQIDVFDLVKLSHQFASWADFEDDILNRNYVESYSLEEIAGDFLDN